jgi:hypothetical protein
MPLLLQHDAVVRREVLLLLLLLLLLGLNVHCQLRVGGQDASTPASGCQHAHPGVTAQ